MTFLISAALSMTSLVVPAHNHRTSIEDIADAIRSDVNKPCAELPSEGTDFPIDANPFSDAMQFTISAIDSQSFSDLFARESDARSIVLAWYSKTLNLESDSEDSIKHLKQAIVDLNNELCNDIYTDLSFGDMVHYRLCGIFPDGMSDLDDRLEALIDAGFQFPLFDKSVDASVGQRLNLLKRFVRKRTSPHDGGLGNASFRQLYYMPAQPYDPHKKRGFPVDKMRRMITQMQGTILPHPDSIFRVHATADECCCNTATHDTSFRRCTGLLGYDCVEMSQWCSTAGSTFCPWNHPFHREPEDITSK